MDLLQAAQFNDFELGKNKHDPWPLFALQSTQLDVIMAVGVKN